MAFRRSFVNRSESGDCFRLGVGTFLQKNPGNGYEAVRRSFMKGRVIAPAFLIDIEFATAVQAEIHHFLKINDTTYLIRLPCF